MTVPPWIVVIADEVAHVKIRENVRTTIPRGTFLVVREKRDDSYKVMWKSTEGWIDRKDALPTRQAFHYFTQAIDTKPTADDYNTRGWIWRMHFK